MVILALEHLHRMAQCGLHAILCIKAFKSRGETWFGLVNMLKIYWSPTCAPTWGILKKKALLGMSVFNLIFLILKNLVIFLPKIGNKNPNIFQFCFGRDCYHTTRMGISGFAQPNCHEEQLSQCRRSEVPWGWTSLGRNESCLGQILPSKEGKVTQEKQKFPGEKEKLLETSLPRGEEKAS